MVSEPPADIAVFAPHPDDAELAAAGLLVKLKARGYRTAIVDLTRGELGTKGDAGTRALEAEAAGKVLELDARLNLDLGDARLADTPELRAEVIGALRRLRPRLVLTPREQDEHPDHRAAFHLVRSAFFLARLPKIDTGQAFHAASQLWTYGIHREDPAPFIVDISEQFDLKRRVLECYRSQFVEPELPDGYRYAGLSNYLEDIEARGRYWGRQIGAAYGEAFSAVTPLRLEQPFPEDLEC